jgi:hypothetical protein
LTTWYRYYALVIVVHALEVAIVGSAAAIIKSARPSYDMTDILIIISVGMIAGAIYLLSINRLIKHEQKN